MLAAVAVLAMAGLAGACELAAGVTPRGQLEATGIVVVFVTVPPVVEVGKHFAVDARVCADGVPPVLIRVDGNMPEHRHGMNYRPTLTAKDGGRWLAEGLLFHMPGRWRLTFDVEHGHQRARLFTEIVLE